MPNAPTMKVGGRSSVEMMVSGVFHGVSLDLFGDIFRRRYDQVSDLFTLGVLLVAIGAKMVVHRWFYVPHGISLLVIAGIIAIGVLASVIATRLAKPTE